MFPLQSLRRGATLIALALGVGLWYGCTDHPTDLPSGPTARAADLPDQQGVRAAIAAQERHTAALMRLDGVVGTAVGLLSNGKPAVQVYLAKPGVAGVPAMLDGVPVVTQVTGLFLALSDPTTRQRPAPVGYSVGHYAITAGTIGARVRDASGDVYILSNNHVLANSNDANIDDPIYQPGPYDGGTAADQVAMLWSFHPIDFSAGGANTMDAAIALSNSNDVGYATPVDDGYGTPSSTIFGDGNGDGFFDNKSVLLGLTVQKYGRTTKLTQGQITGINATITVCYESFFGICLLSATFVDQLVIEPGGFSAGGDSGSLIVTADGNNNPVALLFAGSSTQTIANRIDLVLSYFNVSVDGGETPPPEPLTDVAVSAVSAPSTATQGDVVPVEVTVRNVGNHDVSTTIDVTLTDATDAVTIGTQTVTGLAAGATATLTFDWNTASSSLGTHTLAASQDFADDNAANDSAATTVDVTAPGTGDHIHVGDLDGVSSNDGSTWSAIVEVTVHDVNHAPLNGATVTGAWSPSGLASDECTTGELGGNGTCIVLFPGIRKNVKSVTFTVSSVTMANRTYEAAQNHDVDGSSNGTSITVNR